MPKLVFEWEGRADSDWFTVLVDEKQVFRGHPQNFFYEFSHYADKYGFANVEERVVLKNG